MGLFVSSVTEFSHRYLSYSRCLQTKHYHTGICGPCRKHSLFDSPKSTTLYFRIIKISFYVLMTVHCLLLLYLSLSTIDDTTSDFLSKFSWIFYSNVSSRAKETCIHSPSPFSVCWSNTTYSLASCPA